MPSLRPFAVSNPVLLQVLSQGSDPQAVQQYYEKIFDSITSVEHDRKDKSFIREIMSREGNSDERIVLRRPVKAGALGSGTLSLLSPRLLHSPPSPLQPATSRTGSVSCSRKCAAP